jgi:hypothetical protein
MDDIDTRDERGDRPPGARELLPILPIVPVVTWVARSFAEYPWVTTRAAVAISMTGAALIGLPALFWALDHGYRRLAPLLLIGALVGLMPIVVIVLSAMLGVTVRGGFETALQMIERGAPMPGTGIMPWPTVLRAEGAAAAIGATSAAVYWLLVLVAPRAVRSARDR